METVLAHWMFFQSGLPLIRTKLVFAPFSVNVITQWQISTTGITLLLFLVSSREAMIENSQSYS
ncbi:hypothetical protein EXA21_15470 [Vibrio cincinnatiensis]|uniref:hypothetical protein n=1 Tax=Vibrio cincinnatiensis TaxID=675 RepID=UPI001EDD37EE|nr:hypothetical protein [Vibrio cincinnatiensis]MCG3764185.1 hypothetical protein [Vibrio cincinnatiensis]